MKTRWRMIWIAFILVIVGVSIVVYVQSRRPSGSLEYETTFNTSPTGYHLDYTGLIVADFHFIMPKLTQSNSSFRYEITKVGRMTPILHAAPPFSILPMQRGQWINLYFPIAPTRQNVQLNAGEYKIALYLNRSEIDSFHFFMDRPIVATWEPHPGPHLYRVMYSGSDKNWSATYVVTKSLLSNGKYDAVFTVNYHGVIPKHPPLVEIDFRNGSLIRGIRKVLSKSTVWITSSSEPLPRLNQTFFVQVVMPAMRYHFRLTYNK